MRILVIILFMMIIGFAKAEEVVVVQGAQLEDKVVVLIDVSGSMNGSKSPVNLFLQSLKSDEAPAKPSPYTVAISWFRKIIQGMSDDGELKVYAFATMCGRFEFDPSTSKDGWLQLPNFEELNKCSGWLDNVNVGEYSTDITQAMLTVIDETKDDRVSLILISDLADNNFSLKAIDKQIEGRKFPIIINIIGIDPFENGDKNAIEIVKSSGGTYLKTN